MKSKFVVITAILFALVALQQPLHEPETTFANYSVRMKASDAESVLAVISAEGFDQAFNHYSSYRDIGDPRFHELRKAYISASKDLMDYLQDASGKNGTPYYLKLNN
jgi:hypothetical protein